jgi:hypothetical protein
MELNGANMILKQLSILSVWCAALTLAAPFSLRAENKIPEDCKTGGFFIGCQAYTFNKFTVFEAIDKTAAAGGKVIEFYPGQTLSKDEPNVKWDHNASAETIQKVKAKLAACKITAANYGVVGIPKDEAEARKIFEFAKTLGLYAITTESVESIDTIEKLVKEYDIKVGFHDHPKQAKNPVTRCGTQLRPVRDQDPRRAHRVVRRYGPLGPLRPQAGGLPAHPERVALSAAT